MYLHEIHEILHEIREILYMIPRDVSEDGMVSKVT